ncbi:Protein kinase-like domain containing protein [Rhypophila decipiens]
MAELSPALTVDSSQHESFGEFRDNGLRIEEPVQGLENVYDYELGGHHPVHIGDMLNDQYRVVDKLGVGGHANVWLCRDMLEMKPQYSAVKVLMADASINECHELRVYHLIRQGLGKREEAEYFSLPIDRFDIHGPNGHHFALVYPVLGPPVSKLKGLLDLADSAKGLRMLCAQVVRAMAALHSHGVCHGDFRAANLLLRVQGLAGLSESQISTLLGVPETTRLVQVATNSSCEPWPASAPKYLVKPINWELRCGIEARLKLLTDRICVADFGESFDVNDLPEDLEIPQEYRAPEYILDKRLGIESDLWALGCTLFEIRTGRRLFDLPDDDPDEHLARIVQVLGKFSEPWWSTTWEARGQYFENKMDHDGRPTRLEWWATGRRDSSQPFRPRAIEEALADATAHDPKHAISQAETLVFADLLRRIFKYNPEKRLPAEDILEDAWFRI